MILIFQLIVLLFSVIIHEIAHGAMANHLGDPTAKNMGRLTLNPSKHLDLVGSLIVPLLVFIISRGSFIFGWAKPVLYNPYLLKNPQSGAGLIGIAGPLANFVLAIIFAVLLRLTPLLGSTGETLIIFFNIIIFVNVLLAVFNLLPIPPLDGSKILFSLLPFKYNSVQIFLERWGMIILLFFIIFLWQYLYPIISIAFNFLTGL